MPEHDDRPTRMLLADLTDVADTVREFDPASPKAELMALLAREHALVMELRRRRARWRAANTRPLP